MTADDESVSFWLDEILDRELVDGGEDQADGPISAWQYNTVREWVADWFVPVIRRRPSQNTLWCPRWDHHPEAAHRLAALWSAWETAHLEGGTAPSAWWIYHFDGHWPVLSSPEGPFAGCSKDRPHQDPPITLSSRPKEDP